MTRRAATLSRATRHGHIQVGFERCTHLSHSTLLQDCACTQCGTLIGRAEGRVPPDADPKVLREELTLQLAHPRVVYGMGENGTPLDSEPVRELRVALETVVAQQLLANMNMNACFRHVLRGRESGTDYALVWNLGSNVLASWGPIQRVIDNEFAAAPALMSVTRLLFQTSADAAFSETQKDWVADEHAEPTILVYDDCDCEALVALLRERHEGVHRGVFHGPWRLSCL